ncbi:unnamed protein product [Sphenostylis stenocarpa]|uniref:Uncharacterized protein n=1 Tax=Sphenostylis stenocarpa TaxID=92480 RepID=A0AA86W2R3_9FABA|nr:unnamed protein product [Sphenostylis stenocarpa]
MSVEEIKVEGMNTLTMLYHYKQVATVQEKIERVEENRSLEKRKKKVEDVDIKK